MTPFKPDVLNMHLYTNTLNALRVSYYRHIIRLYDLDFKFKMIFLNLHYECNALTSWQYWSDKLATISIFCFNYKQKSRMFDWHNGTVLVSHCCDQNSIPGVACEMIRWSLSRAGGFPPGTCVNYFVIVVK